MRVKVKAHSQGTNRAYKMSGLLEDGKGYDNCMAVICAIIRENDVAFYDSLKSVFFSAGLLK